ncbi:hypothetical protein C3492_26750 [Streptomyces sp. Ru62]|nr:hypothetical protein C3492_26750 [Streptomyces sp. Ru62]
MPPPRERVIVLRKCVLLPAAALTTGLLTALPLVPSAAGHQVGTAQQAGVVVVLYGSSSGVQAARTPIRRRPGRSPSARRPPGSPRRAPRGRARFSTTDTVQPHLRDASGEPGEDPEPPP